MIKDQNRDYLIDNLKVILILLVVFGHVIEHYLESSELLRSIYFFIYLFHMPLFVLISGYLSKNVDKCRKGIINSLLIPYIVFSILWYIIVSIWSGKFIFSLFNPGWTLWYLISLFIWRLCIKQLVKIPNIIIISFLLAVLIGIIPNSQSLGFILRTITFLPFFLIGYFTKEKYLRYIKLISNGLTFIIVGVFLIISYVIVTNNILNYKFLYNSKSYYDTGLGIVEGIIYKILLYIVSIILSICIINITPKCKMFFTRIGKCTITIYLCHIYIVILLYAIIPKWNMGIMRNTILLTSPLFIIYLLSKDKVNIMYKQVFIFINGSIYPRILSMFNNIKAKMR